MKVYIVYLVSKSYCEIGKVFTRYEDALENTKLLKSTLSPSTNLEIYIIERKVNEA